MFIYLAFYVGYNNIISWWPSHAQIWR